MDLRQEAECLQKVPLFSKLEPSKLKLLAFTSQGMTFEDQEVLFCEGDAADSAYVILGGEVEILVETDDGPTAVGTLGRNELFGELAILNNSPRTATLRAKGKLEVLRISDDMFLNLVSDFPAVALEVMRQLSDKLTRTHRRMEKLQRKLQRCEAKGGATDETS
ncbi:MAG: cyclic nucleotide-binding protein [Gammaproteobacteria bacterium]|nr:MAG: cyclic nucleotide-binding protein [Gammaproteobacteria bacterium]